VLKGEAVTPGRRRLDDIAGNVVVMAAYCNIFLNPLIYILHYDVAKLSLINWMHRIGAKFKNQQPTSSS